MITAALTIVMIVNMVIGTWHYGNGRVDCGIYFTLHAILCFLGAEAIS